MVIATQNPIEYEGTYPLPEAQLDRFMMRLSLGYPSRDEEIGLLQDQTEGDPLGALRPVVTGGQVLDMVRIVGGVHVAPSLRSYVVDLLGATRADRDLYLGGSPRAGIALLKAAKAQALIRERDYVVPQDIKDLAARVLSHRVILSPDGRVHGKTAETVVDRALGSIPVPSG